MGLRNRNADGIELAAVSAQLAGASGLGQTVEDELAEKFGGADKVVMQHVAQEMRITYSVVLRWNKRDIHMIDAGILEKWCQYLNCQPGDILKYVE